MPYFDHNATQPLSSVARDVWLRIQEESWHNPSGLTRASARARLRLDQDRERLADYLSAKPDRLIFTSGASESVQAVFAHWARHLDSSACIALNPTEHPCVFEAARAYLPGRYKALKVDSAGVVLSPEEQDFSEKRPAAVVLMAANNETGVLQPWESWADWAAENGVELLCDATQWLGKLPGAGLAKASWVFGSAHKWGGPKGVGFLVRPAGLNGFHVHGGGNQEAGQRGGTEDVAGVAASVAALVDLEQRRVFLESDRCLWRDAFVRSLESEGAGFRIVAKEAERLWNTVSILVPRGDHHRWVTLLDRRGFQVSTGSACSTGHRQPSHVLAALGLPPADLARVIRASSGWDTTQADWDALRIALLATLEDFPTGPL